MAEGVPLYVAGTPANGAASGYFPTAAGHPSFPQGYYPMAGPSPGAVPLMLPAAAAMHGVGYVPVPMASGGVFFVPSAHHQSQPQTPLPPHPLFFPYQQQHSFGYLPPPAAALPHALAVAALSGSRTNLAASASQAASLGAHDADTMPPSTPSDAPKMTRGKRTVPELYGTPFWWGESAEAAAAAAAPVAPVAPAAAADARVAAIPRASREPAAASAVADAEAECEDAEGSASRNQRTERAMPPPPPQPQSPQPTQSPSGDPAARAAGGASFLVESHFSESDLQAGRQAAAASGARAEANANAGISFEIDLDDEQQPRRVRESLSQFVPSHMRSRMREREELVRSRAGRSRDAALVDSLNVAASVSTSAGRSAASPRVTPRTALPAAAAVAAGRKEAPGAAKQLVGSRAPPNVYKSMELLDAHSTPSESSSVHTAGDGDAAISAGARSQLSGGGAKHKKRTHPALTNSARALPLPVTPRSARTPRAVGGPNPNVSLSSSSARIAIKPPLMTQQAGVSPRKHTRPEANTNFAPEPSRSSKANPTSSAARPATAASASASASVRKGSDKSPVKPVQLSSSQTFNRSGAQQLSSGRPGGKSLSTRRPSGSATAESVMAAIASFPDTKSYLLDKMLAEAAKKPLPAAAALSASKPPLSRPSSASGKLPQPQMTLAQSQAQVQRPASRQHTTSASSAPVGPKPPEFELYPEAQRYDELQPSPVEVAASGESLVALQQVDEGDLDEAEARSETGTYTVQHDSPDEPLDSPENEEATQARLDAAIERALSNPNAGDGQLALPAHEHDAPAAPISAPPTSAAPHSSTRFSTFTRRKSGPTADALLSHVGEAADNADAERTLTAPISSLISRGTCRSADHKRPVHSHHCTLK